MQTSPHDTDSASTRQPRARWRATRPATRSSIGIGLAILAILGLAVLRTIVPQGLRQTPVALRGASSSTATPAEATQLATAVAPSATKPSVATATTAPSATVEPTLEALGEPIVEKAPPPHETILLQGPPALLIDDWRFTSEQGTTTEEIQAFLDSQAGPLKWTTMNVGRGTYTFAEVLVAQSTLYNVSPKVVLALLEQRLGVLSSAEADGIAASNAVHLIIRELYLAQQDYPVASGISFAGTWVPLPEGTNAASYAILRVHAQAASADMLPWLISDQPGTFIWTYGQLFGDPRQPLGPLPGPAQPFLSYPKETRSPVTSFFDHDLPYLSKNSEVVTYWGRRDSRISYDGHTGWDYGGAAGGYILAAAPGKVIFAGWSDDGCWSPAGAVIIDHGNGYRTLYWHLGRIDVTSGDVVERGQRLGLVGSTGCSSGPHLHFQVTYLGRNVDPYGWCGDPAGDPWANHPFGIRSRWLWMDRPSPCEPPEGAVLVAAGGEGFSSSGSWNGAESGLPSGSLWSNSKNTVLAAPPSGVAMAMGEISGDEPPPTQEPVREPEAVAVWQPKLPARGRYRVLAHIPYFYNARRDSSTVYYTVRSAEGEVTMEVNQQQLINEWADLGTYLFDPSAGASVMLHNNTGRPSEGVWAGGVMWIPEE